MAVSNRDRIQKGFEVLAEGLEPFVDARMSKSAPGGDWIAMQEAREEENNGSRKVYERHDPAVLLRCITGDWRVFSRVLTRSQRSLADELIGTRNSWAHNSKFSADDTYRALDTMERLLLAAEAKSEAEALRQMRLDLQRVAFEAETRKAVGQTEAGSSVAGVGVKPWREVLQPHDDVIAGRYLGAEFAADLATVASGSASEDYADL